MTWRERLLAWIEPEDNPRNTVYGTIAAGLVIAAEDPVVETYPRVIAATVVSVVTYWVAHGYAHWVAQRFQGLTPVTAGWSFGGLVKALVHEWPLTEGAAIPVAALAVAGASGVPLPAGDTAALSTAVGALVLFELAGGLRRHLRARHLAANATVGLLLGAALFGVKNLLH